MKNKNPLKPIFTELKEVDYIYMEDEGLIENILVKNQDLNFQENRNIFIKETILEKVMMTHSRLKQLEVSNVLFDRCDFSNSEWIGASFHSVHFKQCKLTGTNFAESYLRDCFFEDCIIDYGSFSFSNQKMVVFEHTSLKQAEFFEMIWKDLYFSDCELSDSNWFNTSLTGLDLTKTTFEKIAFSKELVYGLQVTTEQAIIIAMELGLVIR